MKAFDLAYYQPMLTLGAKIGSWTGELEVEPGRRERVTARGIEVCGIPLGERNYELGKCSDVAAKIVSEIQSFEDQLHPHSKHAAFSVGYYCLLPKFDHWLRHLPPNITAPSARRVDAAMAKYLHGIMGAPEGVPDIVQRRMQLSGRHYGLGYRSRL